MKKKNLGTEPMTWPPGLKRRVKKVSKKTIRIGSKLRIPPSPNLYAVTGKIRKEVGKEGASGQFGRPFGKN